MGHVGEGTSFSHITKTSDKTDICNYVVHLNMIFMKCF